MELDFTAARWQQDEKGCWLNLLAADGRAARGFVRQFGEAEKKGTWTATLQEKRQRRSLDANAYCWVLCQKIAENVRGLTKEDVYKDAVRQAGQFDILPIRSVAVDSFFRHWSGRGTGWMVDIQDESKLPGYVRVIAYYGSSTYDAREMGVLLDYIVSEAKSLNIETATPDELALLKARWDDAPADQGDGHPAGG